MNQIDVKAIRAELGIQSQSELARKLGVDPSTVCGWESGKPKKRPSGTAVRLLEKLQEEHRAKVAA